MSIDGVFAVDKPAGITSRRVAVEIGRILECKAGHCGTLDPIATGVLLVCVGKARLLSRFLSALDKRYRVTVLFGLVTDSYDVSGNVLDETDTENLTPDFIEKILQRFAGEILQTPPAFSAIKSQGKPLYAYARRGELIVPAARRVKIHSISLVDFWREGSKTIAEIEVFCGKGTYMRSLANDLGRVVGCGACVLALRRISIGRFGEEDLISYEVIRSGDRERIVPQLIGMEEATYFLPTVLVNTSGEAAVRLGKPLDSSMVEFPRGGMSISGTARVLDREGKIIAIYGPPKGDDPENILGRAVRVLRPIDEGKRNNESSIKDRRVSGIR